MIYLKLETKPRTVKKLLEKVFSFQYGLQRKSCTTYKDAACTQMECEPNCYRSIDDVINIIQTYFPKMTEVKVIERLLKTSFISGDREYLPYLIHCSAIGKPTLCFISYGYGSYKSRFYPRLNDSLYSKKMGNSKYKDWAEVCQMIGINSEENLKEIHN